MLARQRIPFPGPSVPVRGPVKYRRARQTRAAGQRNHCTHAKRRQLSHREGWDWRGLLL